MNWFKGSLKNKGGAESLANAIAIAGGECENSSGEPSANPPATVPSPPLDETQAWLKSLEPKANPKLVALKRQLHQNVISNLDIGSMARWNPSTLRMEVRRKAEVVCATADLEGLQVDRTTLVDEVLDEVFGLGPLEALRADPLVSDIMINGPKTIYVERQGRMFRTPIIFHDDEHLVQIIQRIVAEVGRRIDETTPMVDARLSDGSRLNAVIAPLALDGALVSIRRFGSKPLTADRLIAN
ncbi:MAG: hypothetical protein RL069_1914, partial [Planctomycetota bacterium]